MPKNAGFAFAHGGGVFGVVLCVLLWCVEWGLVCVCVVGVGFEVLWWWKRRFLWCVLT